MPKRPTSEEANAIARNLWATLAGPAIEKGEAQRIMKRLWRYGGGELLTNTDASRKNHDGSYTVHGYNQSTPMAQCTAVVMADNPWPVFTSAIAFWLSQKYCGDQDYVWLLLTREVIKRGWLDGRLADKLIPPTTKEDRRAQKLKTVVKRIAAWQAKHKRATNALKKLNAQLKRMEKMK